MGRHTPLLAFAFISLLMGTCLALDEPYKENTVDVRIDAGDSGNTKTFKLRYFKNDASYKKGGPLFVVIGGQAGLQNFKVQQMKVVDEIAPKFDAKIVVVEHRFYGASLPFPVTETDVYTNIDKIKHLDISRVLDDVEAVVNKVGTEMEGGVGRPFLFGSGYSGLLAMLYNLKHGGTDKAPNATWISSTLLGEFIERETKDPARYDANLSKLFVETFGCKESAVTAAFEELGKYTNFAELRTIFGITTEGDLNSAAQLKELLNYCVQAVRDIATMNFPYANTVNGKPIPKYPAGKFCESLNADKATAKEKVEALRDALFKAYLNPGATTPFVTQFKEKNELENLGLSDADLKAKNWQRCTQLVFEKCAGTAPDKHKDFFFHKQCAPSADGKNYIAEMCERIVKPGASAWSESLLKPNWINETFWKTENKAKLERVVMSNGQYDPYGSDYSTTHGPITDSYGFSIPAAAAALDFVQPNTCDPSSVVEARTQIVDILECWIKTSSPPGRCTTKESQVELTKSTNKETQPDTCAVDTKGWPWKAIAYPDKPTPGPSTQSTSLSPSSSSSTQANAAEQSLVSQVGMVLNLAFFSLLALVL